MSRISHVPVIAAIAITTSACSLAPASEQANEETGESTSALLQDSWTGHFDCLGANNGGYRPPTLQVHYHEWQTIPFVSPVLRGINGYAFYVYNPNWRVHGVSIHVYDRAHQLGGPLDQGSWTYGGTQSASNAPFGPLDGVDKGKQDVILSLTNGNGDECEGVLEQL